MIKTRNRRDLIGGFLFFLTGVGVLFESLRLKVGTPTTPKAGFFPFVSGIILIALSLMVMGHGWLKPDKEVKGFGEVRRPAILVAGTAIYVVILDPLDTFCPPFSLGASFFGSWGSGRGGYSAVPAPPFPLEHIFFLPGFSASSFPRACWSLSVSTAEFSGMDFLANLGQGFAVALSPWNLVFAFVGAMVGTAIGVLPGLGTPTTIALLLPVTYKMGPISAVIMLAGIFYGAMYGGSTTSILLNIPGEAASIVTCLDGYTMARQGRQVRPLEFLPWVLLLQGPLPFWDCRSSPYAGQLCP